MNSIKLYIQPILLILLQVLLISNLQLMGVCQPFIYILFLLTVPPVVPPISMMLIGAVMGFVMDIFCNSLGIHMAACVLLTFLRTPMIRNIQNDYDRLNHPISSLNIGRPSFIKYIVILTLVHHTTVFLLTAWSIQHILWTLLTIVVSSAVSITLILLYDLVKK